MYFSEKRFSTKIYFNFVEVFFYKWQKGNIRSISSSYDDAIALGNKLSLNFREFLNHLTCNNKMATLFNSQFKQSLAISWRLVPKMSEGIT